jgi:hypothetical protein
LVEAVYWVILNWWVGALGWRVWVGWLADVDEMGIVP